MRERKTSYFCNMKTKKNLFVFLSALLFLSSCDMIDYHPYDGRIEGPHGLNAWNIARIEESCRGKNHIRFAIITDTQRWYDEMKIALADINARGDIDFVLHTGDMTDFGMTNEFELQRDLLLRLNVPFVVLIGNHDCLGSGESVYRYVFGEPNFSFNAGDTHFICLNTNAFEYDYSISIPDFRFIRDDRTALPPEVKRTVAAMHSQPTSEQFNNNVSDLFQEEIKKFPGLQFCVCGHGHHTQVNDLYGDGVLYYECGAAKMREYLVFDLNEDGTYSYEVVEY